MNKTKSAVYPDLKDRSVFISGGATGIGAAIVVSVCQARRENGLCGFG